MTEIDEGAAFADSLEKIAALYRAHPRLPLPALPALRMLVYVATREEMVSIARQLKEFEKEYSDSQFFVKREYGNITLEFFTGRGTVCTRRVIGTRMVTRPTRIEGPDETVEEEIVEWDCDPLLK